MWINGILDILDLTHHLLIHSQTTSGIDDDHIIAVVLGLCDGILGYLDGILRVTIGIDGHTHLACHDFQLIDGSGTIDVASCKQRTLAFLRLQHQGKLAGATTSGIQMIETIKCSGSESGFFRNWAGLQAAVNKQKINLKNLILAASLFLCFFTIGKILYFSGNIESRDQFSRMLENTEEWGSIDLQAESAEDSISGKDRAGKASADSGKSSGKEEASSDTGKTGDAAKASSDSKENGASEKSKDEVQTIHIPIFLASDEEGGLVARIEDSGIGVPYVGPMGEVGASGDPAAAFEAGSTIGGYLHELGINLDFAPDADVLIDPYNQTIGNRSFGTDPFLCGQMVGRFIDGLHDQGVASCIKHFPGLGDTETDTHTGGAWSSRTIEDYRGAEFLSFRGGIEAGTDMVMVSHLSNTALTGSDLPASLNKVVMTDILRDELKFEGVIITDSLQMGAVTERLDSAEAAVTAFEAGADILLMPIDFQAARQGILDAVESGRISEKRIDKSLRRILMTRYRTGSRRQSEKNQ